MAEQRHGRYFAQELVLDQATSKREQIQDALDAGDSRDWHLVGVSDVLVEGGVVLFWDTAWPQAGRFAGRAAPGAPSSILSASCCFIAPNPREPRTLEAQFSRIY